MATNSDKSNEKKRVFFKDGVPKLTPEGHAYAAQYEADKSAFKSIEGQSLSIEDYAKLLEGNSGELAGDTEEKSK
jgi:hypothetical protein